MRVVLQITHRCNLRCSHCFEKESLTASSEGELKTIEIFKIIDHLRPWTILDISGGEPMVRDDIADIVEYAAQKKRMVTLITNGTGIDDAILERIILAGPLCIMISIDGMELTHDRLRRKNGSMRDIIRTINQITKRKKELKRSFPILKIKTTITEENYQDIESLVNFSKELGAVQMELTLAMSNPYPCGIKLFDKWNEVKKHPGNTYTFSDIASNEIQKSLLDLAKNKSLRLMLTPNFNDHNERIHYLKNPFLFYEKKCKAYFTELYISATGEVSACFHKKAGLLKSYDLNVNKIFSSKEYRLILNEYKKNSDYRILCSGCPQSSPILKE